ncbi:MAG TPA: hypothetical protein VH703_01345 [Solirubrobacterales bacterium]
MTVEADGPQGEARGLSLRARRAIVAVPPTLAGRIATTRRCRRCATSSPSGCRRGR